jgi:hypothetical protein
MYSTFPVGRLSSFFRGYTLIAIAKKKVNFKMADTWIKVNNFPHTKGDHCESTTLKNCINFLGFQYSEPFIFGIDASMGFGFWGVDSDSGFILGGKQGFLTEKSLACRLLGLTIEKRTFQRSAEAWKDVQQCLTKNQPIILQVDMGFLPYFTDLNNFHFGGHFISLIGYNDAEKKALVGDNNEENLKEIDAETVEKARSSIEGPRFMHPNNVRYVIQRRPDGKHPPLSGALKLAIQEVVKNMRAPSMGQFGIPGLKAFAKSIPEWPKKFEKSIKKADEVLKWLYGSIETYGTGGSLFRKMYIRFLKEILKLPELKEGKTAWTPAEYQLIDSNLPKLEIAAEKWTEFALIIKKAMDRDKENAYQTLDYGTLTQLSQTIAENEESFFTNLVALKI